jgi:hypothetical protein
VETPVARGEDRLGTRLGHPSATVGGMLYAAKCFWPGLTEKMLREAALRAGSETGQRLQAAFRGALFLPHDELVLCLFEASSGAAVKRASEQAGMPCERVIETVWVAPREE